MLPATDHLAPWLTDASNVAGGHADSVFVPESERELAEFLRECAARGTSVTIAGSGTGLAGGRIPFGGAVISMVKMNRILEIDRASMTATVEPGAILRDVQHEVEALGLFYPPDPTERGGQIGGNVATNASGARTFKYGPTRDWVRGLDVILSCGDKLDLERGRCVAEGAALRLRTVDGRPIDVPLPRYTMPSTSKHAAGYYARQGMDAVDLFVGSEGTLGVVTKARLRLIGRPEAILAGVVFFDDPDRMLDFVEEARARSERSRREGIARDATGIEARALEFIDHHALEFIRPTHSQIPSGAFGGAIWFEQEIRSEELRLLTEWSELIEQHTGLADFTWIATTERDQERIRAFRHAVPSSVYEFIARHGMRKFGTDMAVPDRRFREMFRYYVDELAASGLTNLTWGHIGNSHLHVNILPEREEQIADAQRLFDRFVSMALRLGGTVSAEHGIGKLKRKYLVEQFGAEGIEEMRNVKRALDPAWILGVGTMFDSQVVDRRSNVG